MSSQGAMPQFDQRPWLARNWKWLLFGVTVVLVFLAASTVMVFMLMGSSEAVRMAMERASQHPTVIEDLGQPIERGWLIAGVIQVNPSTGHAELSIPISGPKGKGTLHVNAIKKSGVWELTGLQLTLVGKPDRFDLLRPPTPKQTSPRLRASAANRGFTCNLKLET